MLDTPTNWARKGPIPARKWKNVIISSENHKLLNDAFSRYLNRSQKEIDMEIPHKLCIVLSGPPGFGKTSLIKAIAHEYQLNLYIGALSQMNDSQISGIADSMLPKSALVFEDVDCMAGRESDDPEVAGVKGLMAAMGRSSSGPKVTLSAMLNMLDGLTTLGNIVIMTTNRPEKLDEALLRSERVDVHLRLGPDPEVYSNMLIRFYPEAQLSAGVVADFANRCMDKKLSTADLQAHFRANINDVEAGLRL
jgi:chaperone BCS1